MIKKINKIIGYFVWIPFAVSIGAFILYFKYLFTLKFAANVSINGAINVVMDRYLKIGLFGAFLGVLLVFINKISKVIFNEDKYYHEEYPWTNAAKTRKELKLEKKIKKQEAKAEEEKIENNNINTDTNNNPVKEEIEKQEKYIINETLNSNDKFIKDLNNNNIVKARLIDNEDNKKVEVLEDINDNRIILPESKNQTIIKVDSSKVRIDGFRHCPKCKNLVVDEAVICVHCGVLLDKNFTEKSLKMKKSKINKDKLAINMIIIIVCFIGIILLCHKIESKKSINDANINSSSIKVKSTNR